MPVVFDATFLLLLFDESAGAPVDPATGSPLTRVAERAQFLLSRLSDACDTIIIPTPALAELLTGVADMARVLNEIDRNRHFRIVPFGKMAAVEVALWTAEAVRAGNKKAGESKPWNKVKYDRQIVAIARVESATVIYSDDRGLKATAEQKGVRVIHMADLELPPEQPQSSFRFDDDDTADD